MAKTEENFGIKEFKSIGVSVIVGIVIAWLTWVSLTLVDVKSDIKLINYKLNQNNYLFQELYEKTKRK